MNDREEERRVRCNHCMSEFDEEYGVDVLGPDGGETCPVCLKGDALMDVTENDHDLRIRAEERERCIERLRSAFFRLCNAILGDDSTSEKED